MKPLTVWLCDRHAENLGWGVEIDGQGAVHECAAIGPHSKGAKA